VQQEKERPFLIFLFAKIRKFTPIRVNCPLQTLSQAKGLLQAQPINWDPFQYRYLLCSSIASFLHCDQALAKRCVDAFFDSMLIIGNLTHHFFQRRQLRFSAI